MNLDNKIVNYSISATNYRMLVTVLFVPRTHVFFLHPTQVNTIISRQLLDERTPPHPPQRQNPEEDDPRYFYCCQAAFQCWQFCHQGLTLKNPKF